MAQVAQLARHLAPLVDFLYPPRCPSCGSGVASQAGLCAECWASLEIPGGPQLLWHPAGEPVPIHAATRYNATSRKLVLAYKHGGKIALSRLMAQLMASHLPPPGEDRRLPLLIPVPLHRWRLWGRGFNQSAVLAQELVKLGRGQAMVGALQRHRRTPSLGGLGASTRHCPEGCDQAERRICRKDQGARCGVGRRRADQRRYQPGLRGGASGCASCIDCDHVLCAGHGLIRRTIRYKTYAASKT